MGIRTTVTLDQEVYDQLKAESRKQGKPFKEVLNQTIRDGLVKINARPGRDFVIPTFSAGEHPVLNYDCIGELLEQLEGPLYK